MKPQAEFKQSTVFLLLTLLVGLIGMGGVLSACEPAAPPMTQDEETTLTMIGAFERETIQNQVQRMVFNENGTFTGSTKPSNWDELVMQGRASSEDLKRTSGNWEVVDSILILTEVTNNQAIEELQDIPLRIQKVDTFALVIIRGDNTQVRFQRDLQ